jgi:hypothetical protein
LLSTFSNFANKLAKILCLFASEKPETMKLKFSIQYGTQWGESLHVVVRYISTDGKERQANLLMLTEDGQLWKVETAAIVSRQQQLRSLTYYYQVEDADGRVLRREWTLVPRCYSYDSSKSYVFADQWRDQPLTGRADGENYQIGFLTVTDTPYPELVDAAREVAGTMYRRRASAAFNVNDNRRKGEQ